MSTEQDESYLRWERDVKNMLKEQNSVDFPQYCELHLFEPNDSCNSIVYTFFKDYLNIELFDSVFLARIDEESNELLLCYTSTFTDIQNKKSMYNIENDIVKRIEDINFLEKKNIDLFKQSHVYNCTEKEERIIEDDINVNRLVIKSHKAQIKNYKSNEYCYEIPYVETSYNINYTLKPYQKYRFGSKRLLWLPCGKSKIIVPKPVLGTIVRKQMMFDQVSETIITECDKILL